MRVAGSNPVVRSEPRASVLQAGARVRWSGREARQRPAKPSTRVQIPSPPRRLSRGGWDRPHGRARAISAVVARFPDTEEVTGSNPVSPTRFTKPLVSDQGLPAFPGSAGLARALISAIA